MAIYTYPGGLQIIISGELTDEEKEVINHGHPKWAEKITILGRKYLLTDIEIDSAQSAERKTTATFVPTYET